MRVEVQDIEGRTLGHIWNEGPSTIRSDPPELIKLTRRPLELLTEYNDAAEVVAALAGWSNGYVVCR